MHIGEVYKKEICGELLYLVYHSIYYYKMFLLINYK